MLFKSLEIPRLFSFQKYKCNFFFLGFFNIFFREIPPCTRINSVRYIQNEILVERKIYVTTYRAKYYINYLIPLVNESRKYDSQFFYAVHYYH